jgi:hypothetical protein
MMDRREQEVDKPPFKTRRNDWTWLTVLYVVWGIAATGAALYAAIVFITMVADGRATIPVGVSAAFWAAMIAVFVAVGQYVQTHQLRKRSDENNRKVIHAFENGTGDKLAAKIEERINKDSAP